ncbi:hypothetical protein D9613_012237 [Agrocybe pediades]|uniref:Uncharacterized protein n=1 Tax=Agrocybe pediades TaxID=84607 RepID=A0A8H4QEW2_9AGAR|nr:hypothetical protein D9613_012237 [Agrocybe pediades]
MPGQLKGTVRGDAILLRGQFRSEDGGVELVFAAQLQFSLIENFEIPAVLDYTTDKLPQGLMEYKGTLGPSALSIVMADDTVTIEGQFKEEYPERRISGELDWIVDGI